ncbi:MAG: hypothetical protein R6W86_08110, partial [Marinobacter sp.]|uniref:hypothetical protein n=1 Tax=Marinobacter sp. TaxID=50741 RepID=UPI00396F0A72
MPLLDGRFAVLAAADLSQLFESDGRDALDQSLQVVAGLLVPSRSVEQDEAALVEARFLRDSSHRQILVVLKGGVPCGLFVSRHQGVAPGPLFDDIMEMVPAGRETSAADEPAVAEQRRVHAQIRHQGLRRKTFLAGADNAIRCWIALPEPEAGAVADTVIPTVKLPPEGITLDVVLRWKDQTDHGKLHLPCDRTARSNDCDLHIHLPDNERFVSAEVAFLYRGRAFEIVRVEAYVLPPGRVEQPDDTVEVRVQLAQREVVELADSNEVDMVMIYGEDRTRVDRPDSQGPTALQIYSSTSGASFDLKDPDEIMNYLNTELFAAETSLVRRRVRQGQTAEVLDAGDPDVLQILRTLARHGAALYNSLGDGFEDPGRRIQVQNSSPKEYSPVEFVYDRGWPTDDATICEEGLAALESDADDCPHCKSAADLEPDLRIANSTICPFGFWSLQKIIERRDAAPSGVKDVGGQSFPLPDRRHLSPIDSVLFASSDKVPLQER